VRNGDDEDPERVGDGESKRRSNREAQDRFRKRTRAQMDKLQNRETELEGKNKELEGQMKKLEGKKENLEEEKKAKTEKLAQEVKGLMVKIDSLTARIDNLTVRIDNLTAGIDGLVGGLAVRIDGLDWEVRQLSGLIWPATTLTSYTSSSGPPHVGYGFTASPQR